MVGMKKRIKKKIGGSTAVTRDGKGPLKKVKGIMTDRQRTESQQPSRKAKSQSKSAKGSTLKNPGVSVNPKPVKNAVRSKDGKIVRSKSGKAITFGGANKGGAKSREGRMGGGMMKKRMKRGGTAKKKRAKAMGGGMMKKRMKAGGKA